jgi:hypothetical protein
MAIQAQQHIIDSMNTALAKKQVIDSMNEVSRTQYVIPQVISPVVQRQSPAPLVHYASRSTRTNYASYSRVRPYRSYRPYRPYRVAQAPVYQQVPQRRRGWSAKAKGAVIGTGVGALTGAVVNGRNRAVGAVIGGLLGAGAGTGIGAIIDNRNGR